MWFWSELWSMFPTLISHHPTALALRCLLQLTQAEYLSEILLRRQLSVLLFSSWIFNNPRFDEAKIRNVRLWLLVRLMALKTTVNFYSHAFTTATDLSITSEIVRWYMAAKAISVESQCFRIDKNWEAKKLGQVPNIKYVLTICLSTYVAMGKVRDCISDQAHAFYRRK